MPVTYEAWLVLLSIVMAIQGAYVGLSLALQIASASGTRRRLLLAGATVSFAVAIWTMHFVGMLAVRLPFQVDYLVLPTLLSFLVCAIVVGGAVYATSSGPLTLLRLTLSSCLMGGGIFAMHYLGMSALDASTHMVHDPIYVGASMAIAIAASGLALWLATGQAWRAPLILSAAAFGMAISGMHYTAMTGVTLYPFVTSASAAPALSTDLLAIVVAVVAFCVFGIFFLLLLPDSARTEPVALALATVGPVAQAVGADIAAVPAAEPEATAEIELGRGGYGPLGGAGSPPGVSPAICRSSATAIRTFCRSSRWSPSMPTLTTPTSSTAMTNCFVRSPSATSNRGSTIGISSVFTAATSSTSSASSAIGGRATMKWSKWRGPRAHWCR